MGGVDNTCHYRFSKQFGELPVGYDHKYVYSHFGYNLKVTDMQAAIGCAQLEKLDDIVEIDVYKRQRLKWREVFIFKALIGTLEKKNNGSLEDTRAILLFPEGMSSVSKPYFEAGVGIENIFRILRVDAIWRLSHRHSVPGQKVQNFAVNFSINLNF